MKGFGALLVLATALACANADVYMKETFSGDWESRWKHSSWKVSDGNAGKFTKSAGKWSGETEADAGGIQTGPDSKFFAIYSELDKTFDNTGKDLVVQYSVKHEQNLDCGGGYIKLLPASSASKMAEFGGETPYSIMFGPDICGFSQKKVHVIFTHKEKNHLIKKEIASPIDELTHVYTLVLKPDNTFKVYIDLKEVSTGSLEEDYDILLPKKIKDPKAVKPEEWDERAQIPDPTDIKPAGHDDIPATIPDAEASQPEDWDEEEDGTWEPPVIPNPEFKGEWKQKMIENPDFKGTWVAPDIDNPEYKPDATLYNYKDLKYVGFELWQVKSGSIFDNIMVTDDFKVAEKFAEDTWGATKDAEKVAFDKIKEEEKASKEAEEKSKAESEPAPAMDDEDEDDDDYPSGGKDEL